VRLCLSIEIQEGLSYADTLTLTRTAEELGFDAALLAEHYYPSGVGSLYPGGLAGTLAADAWMYLGALARDTARIRLGTLVSPVTFRHPAVLAKMAATLDHVSGGRAELGMGAGWLESEHAAFGIPFGSPKQRVDLLEEQLQVVRGLLHGPQPFSFAGRHYELRECWFTPHAPRLPLIVGGRADSRRLLRLAAQFADEYVITLASVEQCRAVRDRLTAAAERSVRLALFTPACVAETEAQAERLFERIVAEQPIMARMATSRDAWLIGSPAHVQSRIAELEAAGVDRLMLPVLSDAHREMLPLLTVRSA
jgi:alkanesulfonate monooxygenase SsuD/methylene tetrahydromethanopterin reductase-like flavin-dependent oxidoreductase (luciferase family)